MIFGLASSTPIRPVWLGAVALLMAGGAAAIGYAAGSSQPHVVSSHALANAPGKTLTAVVVDYLPGAKSKPHRHAGVVFAYVLAGAVRSQVNEEPPRIYQSGESFFEDLNSHHAISENASETEPARLPAVLVADTGATLTTYDE
jgi:quercetin dioxygenase-like cupin family protein